MQNALPPGDYEIVHSVYKALAESEWFVRTEENEKACAKFVLSQFGDGGLTALQLRLRCEEIARERFGRRS